MPTMLQSIRSSASASVWTERSTFSQVPPADQRRCRSWQVFHFPKRVGRSRQGIPVRRWNRMPLITLRRHFRRPPRPTFFGRCGSDRAHYASERSPRPTPAGTISPIAGHMTHRTRPNHLSDCAGARSRFATRYGPPRPARRTSGSSPTLLPSTPPTCSQGRPMEHPRPTVQVWIGLPSRRPLW